VSALLFYFIRHGETDWNVERRLQGSRDIPLNGRGRRQAAQCGDTLRSLIETGGRTPADFAYASSPLLRASETMDIVRGALGLPAAGYATDPRLAELSFGRWEGRTYKEIGAANPAALKLRDRDRWNHRPPGGESYADLLVRLRAWYDGVTGNVVVTAHGGVARAIMVMFGVRTTAEVPLGDIEQGVVFEFAPGAMKKHY
jgi:broad specificity phosphatase PhoE